MTVEDVKRVFGVADSVGLPDGSQVSVERFAELFAAAPSTPTPADLRAVDGGTLGYEAFIARFENPDYVAPEITELQTKVTALQEEVRGIRERAAAAQVADPDAAKVRDAVAGP